LDANPDEENKRFSLGRFKTFLIGRARDPRDPGVFHRLALIAFFAWIGLGADGLSSSCYGPSEAFIVLGANHHLGLFVALGTAITIFVISAGYSQIIELFPTGGGGYLVASKLLSPTLGMISGCALLIDYMLTISLSVASGAEAIFSFLPPSLFPYRVEFAVLGVLALIILNLRGVKESVITLMPIFLVFVGTHLFVILYALGTHLGNFPQVAGDTVAEVNGVTSQVGLLGLFFILLRSYSMGAGTYTGIEAVSNGLPILRDPKVHTGKRTMSYMAISLAVTVLGLMLAYVLYRVEPVSGKTLNAVLFGHITSGWGSNLAYTFVLVTLLSEGAILFVAAQTGFIDGPRVLANMALDRWLPTKFANLSDRLVTQNGVLLMGLAALLLIIATGGSVQFLIVLYSINVFITFVLSQAGMVRHWWNVKVSDRKWKKHIFINGIGLLLTAFILISVTTAKFDEGGWITLIVTGTFVLLAVLTKRHYKNTFRMLGRLDSLVEAVELSKAVPVPNVRKDEGFEGQYDPNAMTAVILVNGYNGLGLHAVFGTFRLFKGIFKNFVFVQIGVVDAGVFKGKSELDRLQTHIRGELERYVDFLKKYGYYSEGISAIGIDVADEIDQLAPKIIERFPQSVFFGGQIVFQKENFLTHWLHNYMTFVIQKRFYNRGIPFVILPVRV